MTRPIDPGDPVAFRAGRLLDVLIPTRNRPAELATTLSGLAGQPGPAGFGVLVSDQSDGKPSFAHPAAAAMARVLRHRGHPVRLARHLPARGMAEQRAFLLAGSTARYVLFLDDDVWLEPGAVDRLVAAIERLGCGFVGNAVQGLSYSDDVRPAEQAAYEEWPGRPEPERIRSGGPGWDRWRLHSAANLLHIAARLDLAPERWRAYKVAWIGGCVLFDREKLVRSGGFDFWPRVPADHQGEDVAAQLRVMERDGAAGVLPSGAFHLESPTTLTERGVECWQVVFADEAGTDYPPVSEPAGRPADGAGVPSRTG